MTAYDRLLVVVPGDRGQPPLSPYAEDVFRRVLRHSEKVLGPWRSVKVVSANGASSLRRAAEHYNATCVLLVGPGLAGALQKYVGGQGRTGHLLYGLLAEVDGRRWIATPPLSAYGEGEEATWKKASLLGYLYRHLELLRIGHVGWANPAEPVKTRLVRSADDWRELKHVILDAKTLAIDTETRDLRRIRNVLLTMQFGADGRTGWVVPFSHPGSPLSPELVCEIKTWLKGYFERGKRAIHCGANYVFDMHQILDALGVRWYNHDVWDVTAGAYNLDENTMLRPLLGFRRGEIYALERLCQENGMFHYDDSPVKKSERSRLEQLPLADVATYGALDGALPLRLMHMQRALARHRNLRLLNKPYERYDKAVVEVEGAKITQFCFMERNGLLVDAKYLVGTQGPNSQILREIREADAKLRVMPEVIEANRRILKGQNVRAGAGLFGKNMVASAIDFGKYAHLKVLFFDVKKLRPLSLRKDKGGSIDDEFKRKYKDDPVVAAFADMEAAKKTNSTFLAGIYKILRRSLDNRDGRVHTVFQFLYVKTGRSGSTEPNLQNIPEHKNRAKMVKRQFISRRGRLICKRDFSAHEVRMTGATAKDPAIAKTFWNGMQVRLKYELQVAIPKERQEWWGRQLKAADVHYQNYGLIYSVPPLTVTKPQRDGVKRVIFGVTYGKGIPALAKDISTGTIASIKFSIKELEEKVEKAPEEEVAALEEKLEKVDAELATAENKDWEAEARKIHALIFKKTFKASGDWIERCKKMGAENACVVNSLGGVRHLYGYLHPERFVRAAMDRRGPNSSIQGPSSNLGFKGAYFTRMLAWEWFTRRGIDLDAVQCNSVHDSTDSEVAFVNIPLWEYLSHHGFTTQLHIWMRDVMHWPLMVGFEMDSKVGACHAAMLDATRWDAQVAAIQKGIEWGNAELGWGEDVGSIMPVVEHNAKIIHELRREEILRQLRDQQPVNYFMAMSKDNALKLGLKFSVPEKRQQAGRDYRDVLDRALR